MVYLGGMSIRFVQSENVKELDSALATMSPAKRPGFLDSFYVKAARDVRTPIALVAPELFQDFLLFYAPLVGRPFSVTTASNMEEMRLTMTRLMDAADLLKKWSTEKTDFNPHADRLIALVEERMKQAAFHLEEGGTLRGEARKGTIVMLD